VVNAGIHAQKSSTAATCTNGYLLTSRRPTPPFSDDRRIFTNQESTPDRSIVDLQAWKRRGGRGPRYESSAPFISGCSRATPFSRAARAATHCMQLPLDRTRSLMPHVPDEGPRGDSPPVTTASCQGPQPFCRSERLLLLAATSGAKIRSAISCEDQESDLHAAPRLSLSSVLPEIVPSQRYRLIEFRNRIPLGLERQSSHGVRPLNRSPWALARIKDFCLFARIPFAKY